MVDNSAFIPPHTAKLESHLAVNRVLAINHAHNVAICPADVIVSLTELQITELQRVFAAFFVLQLTIVHTLSDKKRSKTYHESSAEDSVTQSNVHSVQPATPEDLLQRSIWILQCAFACLCTVASSFEDRCLRFRPPSSTATQRTRTFDPSTRASWLTSSEPCLSSRMSSRLTLEIHQFDRRSTLQQVSKSRVPHCREPRELRAWTMKFNP